MSARFHFLSLRNANGSISFAIRRRNEGIPQAACIPNAHYASRGASGAGPCVCVRACTQAVVTVGGPMETDRGALLNDYIAAENEAAQRTRWVTLVLIIVTL